VSLILEIINRPSTNELITKFFVDRKLFFVTKFQIKAKSKPISSFSINMRPYKIPSSFFFCPQGRPFLNFSTLSIPFPQRVSEDVNSIHIQFDVKITVAKKT
jgi:hypothetical protein